MCGWAYNILHACRCVENALFAQTIKHVAVDAIKKGCIFSIAKRLCNASNALKGLAHNILIYRGREEMHTFVGVQAE